MQAMRRLLSMDEKPEELKHWTNTAPPFVALTAAAKDAMSESVMRPGVGSSASTKQAFSSLKLLAVIAPPFVSVIGIFIIYPSLLKVHYNRMGVIVTC